MTCSLKNQLAIESVFSLVRLRKTGQQPTHEDSPLLMDVWQWMLFRILAGGPVTERRVQGGYKKFGSGKAFNFSVTSLWDYQNRLIKFLMYDVTSGSLLLVGDVNGPVFHVPKPPAVQVTPENQSQTNEKDISMKPLSPINPPHPALALPNHVAYKATREEVAALYRRPGESQRQDAAPAAAASSTAASRTLRLWPALAPAPAAPRVLSKAEQANAAVAYSKAHSVSVVQALKTLGFAS